MYVSAFIFFFFFFFNDTATTEIYTLSLHDALPISVITAIYILTSAVFLYLVPLERVTSGETFAAQAGEALFGAAGGKVFALIVIVAVLGSLLRLLMALPRAYYAMARGGVFFPSGGVVHSRFGTPAPTLKI